MLNIVPYLVALGLGTAAGLALRRSAVSAPSRDPDGFDGLPPARVEGDAHLVPPAGEGDIHVLYGDGSGPLGPELLEQRPHLATPYQVGAFHPGTRAPGRPPIPQPNRARRGVKPSLGQYSVGEAEALLQGGLVGLNIYQMKVMGVPGISEALHTKRVRYDRRDPAEHWRSIREIWEAGDDPNSPMVQHRLRGGEARIEGRGDCEDLAAAVAAERTLAGKPSQLMIIPVRKGLSHAVVMDLRTGKYYDPSITGGMGGKG